jgi:hypothetical protein
VLETRNGENTIDHQHEGFGPFPAGNTLEVGIAGRGGVQADASAAVLNVTVTGNGQPGFLTVCPCGTPRPTESNVNYAGGQTIANAVVAKIGDNGKVCVYNSSITHIIFDINGYVP